VAAAAFALGLSLAGPQAAGVAVADDADPSSVSAEQTAQTSPTQSSTAQTSPTQTSPTQTGPARSGRAAQPVTGRAARASSARVEESAVPESGVPAAAAEAGADRPARAAARAAAAAAVGGSDTPTGTARRGKAGRTPAVTAANDQAPAAEAATGRAVVAPEARLEQDVSAPVGDQDAAAIADALASTESLTAAPTRARAVAGVATVSVPIGTAAATSVIDWFSALVAPFQALLEGVALLVRRTFFNQAPYLTPLQTTGQLTGPINGTLGAVDPEGDPITYRVTAAPAYGSVEIGADGSYTYTPGEGFTGIDNFNVAATDTGFHINLLDLFRPESTEAFIQVAQNPTRPMLTFTFVYGAGSQHWTPQARSALQTAATLLASRIVVTAPTTITYDVTAQNSILSTTLATAGSDLTGTDPGFYATVVEKKIQTGVDSNGSDADGEIEWNFGPSWALGNSVGGLQYDFTSTAMHELLHTFGFLSYVDRPGANTGQTWTTFDSFIVTSGSTPVINPSDFRWITAYNPNLTGGNDGLYFGGTNAVAVYGGLVPLHTPNPWQSGSSISHLDESTPSSGTHLMNPTVSTGLGLRELSPMELAILKDLGYNVTETPPVALFLVVFGLVRRRKTTQR